MSVENWEDGQGLSWSGKWHIFNPAWLRDRFTSEERSFCGIYAYTLAGVPRRNERLMAILSGDKSAPVCKKCQRSAAGQ